MVLADRGLNDSKFLPIAQLILKHNNRLRMLDISQNMFLGENSFRIVARIVKQAPNLSVLKFEKTNPSEAILAEILSSIKGSSLTELHISKVPAF